MSSVRRWAAWAAGLGLACAVAGCGRPGAKPAAPAPAGQAGIVQAINAASLAGAPKSKLLHPAYDPALVKLQVLLDRARFSPGVIDGRASDNLQHALGAYARSLGLSKDGKAKASLWPALLNRLTAADARPAMRTYVIDPDDIAGPFTPVIPTDLALMSRMEMLGYGGPAEALAEMFHLDLPLLKALNPGVDFSRPGVPIVVADRGGDDMGAEADLLQVDRKLSQLRAYDAKGRLLAAYPATVGSPKHAPAAGEQAVQAVIAQPTYDVQTGRAAPGATPRGASELAPGPNSPMGVVWIELTDPTCGIHGSPSPEKVGKVAVLGCATLTNWDARELARAVRIGARVVFQ